VLTRDQLVLQVDQLTWQADNKPIIQDISFAARANEFIGIIGPNGAGKSTLLRCIYQKYTNYSGSIQLLGQDIASYSRMALARTLAVVLQEPMTDFSLRVEDVIQLGLVPHRSLLSRQTKADLAVVAWGAEQVEIQHKLKAPFHQLSGGEKQRVMIARAMVQCPKLLLLDEPTNHLDIHHQIEVLRLVKNMGISVIASIHDLNLAAAFCDRILLINQGKAIAFGSPEEVITTEHLSNVFNVQATVDKHPLNDGLRINFVMNPQVQHA